MLQRIKVKVSPRAAQNKIVGWRGDALHVRITAPPVEGKANQALIKFLALEFGVGKSSIRIVKGETSREKVLEVPAGAISLQNQLI